MIPPHVQQFAKAFYAGLLEQYWGDIEPAIFDNIAHGIEHGEELRYNKYSRQEMEDAVEGMTKILTKILPGE